MKTKPETGALVPRDPIHEWFGLSYASYLVIPRAILQSCTADTQQALIDALELVHGECSKGIEKVWPHEADINVQLRDPASGQFIKDDLANYDRGRRRLWVNKEDEGRTA